MSVCFPTQSGQENDTDDVAVDDQDYLNEDELAELQRDEENIKKEVRTVTSVHAASCVRSRSTEATCISPPPLVLLRRLRVEPFSTKKH